MTVTDDRRQQMFSPMPGLVAVETIELRHPAFVDDQGQPTAIRVANDGQGFTATLESDAPMNTGEAVAFRPGRFEMVWPDSPDQGLPKATVAVSNVARLLSPYLDLGVSSADAVEVSFREYLSDDFTKPAAVLHGLTLATTRSGLMRVEGDLSFDDILNAPFHDAIYRTDVYRGLAR